MSRRTIRPRTLATLCPVGALGSVALMGIGAGSVSASSRYDGRPFERASVIVVLLLVGAALATFLVLLSRVRFDVGPSEVVVRNPIRRHVVPIADVQGLDTTRGGDWAYLHQRSGARILVMALSVGARWTLARRLRELNDDLGWSSP